MSALEAGPSHVTGAFPVARTRLIGRERERRHARALLVDEAAPLLTLTGPGGSGKTRLAQGLAAELSPQLATGVTWVDLASLADAALTPLTVAQALGLTPAPGLPINAQVTDALRAHGGLLVLDNCEHLLEPVADLVAGWLSACPDLQVVATSRAPLRLRGERELPVDPFPLPPPSASDAELLQNDAVRLFAERAEAVNPRFTLDAGTVRDVAAICRALDGLPLAIELAAARLRFLSLSVLHDEMADRLDALRGGARDLPARHRTMADTIAWSYALLTPSQQAAFRRLGVFAGGWTLPAALAVAASAAPPAAAMDDLTVLLDQSLIRRDDNDAGLRFTMLETIREFALRELSATSEAPATRTLHAAWYRDLVESLDLHHAMQGDSARTRHLLAEQDNLRQALAWLDDSGDSHSLNRLSAALAKFWFDVGQFSEARHWLHLAIAEDEGVDLLTRARAWNKASWLAMCQGDLERAATLRATGLDLARAAGETFLLAESVFEAGILAFWQGELAQATALIEEAQRALAVIDEEYATAPLKMCSTVNLLGGIALMLGDVPLAVQRGETAVRMARSLDAGSDLSYALCGLGYARFEAGDLPAAAACFLEAMAITWRKGDLAFLARLHWAFAGIALHRRQPDLAGQLMGAADALDARTGSAMWPNDRALAEWAGEQLATVRPASATVELRREGAQLPTEQPVVLAMRLTASILGQDEAAAAWALGNGPALPAQADAAPGRARTFPGQRRLTAREQAVLLHLIDGRTDREIADHLFISRRTVSKHLEAIFAKLGVHTRGAAVAEAQRLGLTDPPSPADTASADSAE